MFSKNKKDQEETLDANIIPKKKLPGWVIIPVIAVLGVGVFAASKFSSGNDKAQGVSLNVTTVKTGDIKEIYNASGKIESENTKTYYSPVTAPITRCNIAVGDTVKAGDVIVSFDTTNLERDNQKAQLSLQTSLNSTQAAYSQNAKAIDAANATSTQAADEANQLAGKVNDLDVQMKALFPAVEAEAPELNELRTALAEQEAIQAYNQTILDDINEKYPAKRAELEIAENKTEKDDTDQAIIATLGEIYKQYDESEQAIISAQTKINDLNEEIAKKSIHEMEYLTLETNRNEAYAQWEAAYNAAMSMTAPDAGMTAAEAANLEISDNIAELTALTPAELVAKGREGMKADMNGVVASVDALQSNTATQGLAMFTIATTDKVRMKIEISPDDYDKMIVGNEATITVGEYKYKGKLTKVNKIAVNNEKGNPVIGAQIRIENPDKNLCIGATAKVSMTVAESQNVLTIPTEVINTSSEGDFVYIIKDGIVEKKDVELGTSSTASIEVKSGLEEGDQVVNDLNVDINEGMKATPLDAEAISDATADKK